MTIKELIRRLERLGHGHNDPDGALAELATDLRGLMEEVGGDAQLHGAYRSIEVGVLTMIAYEARYGALRSDTEAHVVTTRLLRGLR